MAVNDTWPWTSETTAQGFLSGRWLRRAGDVYGLAAARGVPGPNSAIAGGEDVNAKVSTSSGEPRSGAINPTGNIRPSISR